LIPLRMPRRTALVLLSLHTKSNTGESAMSDRIL
jgi:hypothetical protein